MACAVRRRAVKIRYADGNRLCAALEVRAYRSTEHTELILVRRLHANDRIGSEQIRTDIQGRSCAVGRYIGSVRLYYLCHSVNKTLLRKYRHLQTLRGLLQTLRVQIRTEGHDMTVFCRVSFQTFKHGLRILQHAGALINHYSGVIGQSAFIPGSVLIIGYIPLVRLDIAESKVCPVNILFLHNLSPPKICRLPAAFVSL